MRVVTHTPASSCLEAFGRYHLLGQIIFKRRDVSSSYILTIFLAIDQLFKIGVLAGIRSSLLDQQRRLVRGFHPTFCIVSLLRFGVRG